MTVINSRSFTRIVLCSESRLDPMVLLYLVNSAYSTDLLLKYITTRYNSNQELQVSRSGLGSFADPLQYYCSTRTNFGTTQEEWIFYETQPSRLNLKLTTTYPGFAAGDIIV